MGVDEEGMLRQVKAHRKELVDGHRDLTASCPLLTG